jgi:hypothetical protein
VLFSFSFLVLDGRGSCTLSSRIRIGIKGSYYDSRKALGHRRSKKITGNQLEDIKR